MYEHSIFQEYCTRKLSSLVSIESESENTFVQNLARAYGNICSSAYHIVKYA